MKRSNFMAVLSTGLFAGSGTMVGLSFGVVFLGLGGLVPSMSGDVRRLWSWSLGLWLINGTITAGYHLQVADDGLCRYWRVHDRAADRA